MGYLLSFNFFPTFSSLLLLLIVTASYPSLPSPLSYLQAYPWQSQNQMVRVNGGALLLIRPLCTSLPVTSCLGFLLNQIQRPSVGRCSIAKDR